MSRDTPGKRKTPPKPKRKPKLSAKKKTMGRRGEPRKNIRFNGNRGY